MLLSRVTGSVSSGNLLAIDAIDSKAREIAGDDIVGKTRKVVRGNTVILSPNFVTKASFSTDNRSVIQVQSG